MTHTQCKEGARYFTFVLLLNITTLTLFDPGKESDSGIVNIKIKGTVPSRTFKSTFERNIF